MKALIYEKSDKISQFNQLIHAIFYHLIEVKKVKPFRFIVNIDKIYQFFLEINDIVDIEFNTSQANPYSRAIDSAITDLIIHKWIKLNPYPKYYLVKDSFTYIKDSIFYQRNRDTINEIAILFQFKLGYTN